ncbi:hypothetical protein GQ457_01G052840 [Hibiscus cannabinus]
MDKWACISFGYARHAVLTLVQELQVLLPAIVLKKKKLLAAVADEYGNPLSHHYHLLTRPCNSFTQAITKACISSFHRVEVMCSMQQQQKVDVVAEENGTRTIGMSGSLLAAVCAAAVSSPAMALVDARMCTEGTGLPFGLSNNLLGWILFGVFGLIWALYFVYTATLEEDEESGLSL